VYILDLRKRISQTDSLNRLLQDVVELSAEVYQEMGDEEALWVLAPSEKDLEHWPVGLAAADIITEKTGFTLKNLISRYHGAEVEDGRQIANAYEDILFLVKNKREYYFDKDSIRVGHVYEGNEWNERSEGKSSYHDYQVRRYNPKGKDPGNVWLREIRSDTPDETVDRVKPFPRPEAIRRCVLAGSKEEGLVTAVDSSDDLEAVVEECNRRLRTRPFRSMLGQNNAD